MIREGKLKLETGQGLAGECFSGLCSTYFDLIGNLCLVPRFNERDPETFFVCLFVRVADARS